MCLARLLAYLKPFGALGLLFTVEVAVPPTPVHCSAALHCGWILKNVSECSNIIKVFAEFLILYSTLFLYCDLLTTAS